MGITTPALFGKEGIALFSSGQSIRLLNVLLELVNVSSDLNQIDVFLR